MGRIGYINIAVGMFQLQIFFVSLLFCYRCERRRNFARRLSLLGSTGFLFFFFVPRIPLGFLNLSFTLVFLANSLIMWGCFRISWRQILFYDAVAGLLQNLVAKLVTLFSICGWVEERTLGQLMISTLLFVWSILLFYMIFLRKTEDNYNFKIPGLKFAVLLSVYILVVLLYSPFADWYFSEALARVFLCLNFITIDLISLFMAFGVFEKSYLENEKEIMERLLHLQKSQMQQSTDNVESLNRKCHDMLRTLELMGEETTSTERKKYIEDLKKTVRVYDLDCKTGNKALDVLLIKYGLICEEQKIRFTYMVDGEALSFMEDCDIYSLFGNALENAIESLTAEKDETKRILEVLLKRRDDFVVAEIGNYFSGEVLLKDGWPETTKEDDDCHGYGIKSMRYVTEKYGGNLYVGKENHFFVVRAMFCL